MTFCTYLPHLTLELSAIERLALLPDDKDFVFDFSNDTDPANAIAGAKNFPALVGTGASLSIATFDGKMIRYIISPCITPTNE